jgi:hypothetical protein
MGFGSPPLVLEGDYSDWTIYDVIDSDPDAAESLWGNYALVPKGEKVILLVDTAYWRVKKYDISTKTLQTMLIKHPITGEIYDALLLPTDLSHPGVLAEGTTMEATIKSVLGTYHVGLFGSPAEGIVVWKRGEVTKVIADTQMGFLPSDVYSVSISPTGKYIIVSGTRIAPGNVGWVILVGT